MEILRGFLFDFVEIVGKILGGSVGNFARIQSEYCCYFGE